MIPGFIKLHPYVNIANREAGWNFQWDASENIHNLQNIN